jgi:hypothetical protein
MQKTEIRDGENNMEIPVDYVDTYQKDIGMGDQTKELFDLMNHAKETLDCLASKIAALQPIFADAEKAYKQARLNELKLMDYETYLKTPEWKYKRNQALENAYKICQKCGVSGVDLHVHHKTYERRGEELSEDLIVLCKDCHAKEHNLF